jgi:hypothetical protein
MDAFIQISDKVIILKDEFGNAYLPQYSFNGVGELQFAKGYQIKLNEMVDNFQFCPTIINLEE